MQTLEKVCTKVGWPKTTGVDNCSEFISFDLCACAHDVTLDVSGSEKPADTGVMFRQGNGSTGSIPDPSSRSIPGSARNA